MSFTNAPIHDLLIRIKNAYMARRVDVAPVIYSKFKIAVLDLLHQYRFIAGYEVIDIKAKKYIKVKLHPVKNPAQDIPVVRFYSTPGRRYYVWSDQIKSVASGRGIWILSTNQWLLASHVAKAKKIWGELIAEIY
jgi:small subunit ribosomal protein S8